MNLTKLAVDKLSIPESIKPGSTAQKRYYDDKLKGFGVRVTSGGTKAFFIEKLIKGKLARVTLGRYPDLTVEMARKQAQKFLGQIATGIDPIAEKRAAKMRGVTLSEVFDEYLQTRKALKFNTTYNYKRILKLAFSAWLNKPLVSITKDKVAKLHEKIGKDHGEAYANLAMRILRALFNFAAGQYEDAQGKSLITENPVKRLSQTRAWYRIDRRQSFIKAHELKRWFRSVNSIPNKIIADYLFLLLFTGLRRQEAATLKWEQVDLNAKCFTINNTKNHQQHVLPISDYLNEIFLRCKQYQTNEYVFPGTGSTGYIIEPRRQIRKVITETGIQFSLHDLRRTFITIAESLDISAYALKRLLNHQMNQDVTSGYLIIDVERLRKPMQQITEYLLKCMGVQKTTVRQLTKGVVDEQTA